MYTHLVTESLDSIVVMIKYCLFKVLLVQGTVSLVKVLLSINDNAADAVDSADSIICSCR